MQIVGVDLVAAGLTWGWQEGVFTFNKGDEQNFRKGGVSGLVYVEVRVMNAERVVCVEAFFLGKMVVF